MGAALARKILETGPGGKARVLALRGGLGAGKTNFVQGFAKELGLKDRISSPTFVILKKYSLTGRGRFKTFYHIDCYRLNSEKDLAVLGIAGILADPANIVAVEWPEIIGGLMPKEAVGVDFELVSRQKRRITIVLSAIKA